MGNQRFHIMYREQIVDFMRDHRAAFAGYIDGDYDTHLDLMRQHGTWETDAEIIATATFEFSVPLEISGNGTHMNLSSQFHFQCK